MRVITLLILFSFWCLSVLYAFPGESHITTANLRNWNNHKKQSKKVKLTDLEKGDFCYVEVDNAYAFDSRKNARRYGQAISEQSRNRQGSLNARINARYPGSLSAIGGNGGSSVEIREEIEKELKGKTPLKKGTKLKVFGVYEDIISVKRNEVTYYVPVKDVVSENVKKMRETGDNGIPLYTKVFKAGDIIELKSSVVGFSLYRSARAYGALLYNSPEKAKTFAEGKIKNGEAVVFDSTSTLVVEDISILSKVTQREYERNGAAGMSHDDFITNAIKISNIEGGKVFWVSCIDVYKSQKDKD